MKVSARSLAALGAIAMGLGNLGRIPVGTLGGRTAPFVLADLVTVAVWLAMATLLFSGRVRAILDEISLPAVLFVLVAAVSTVLAVKRYHLGLHDTVGTAAFLVRWVLYFGWYLFVVWCLTASEARAAWRYIELTIVAFAAFGIVQSIFLPGFAQLVDRGSNLPGWDVQGHRLVSTILDPNFAGILIVVALLFRLARVAENADEHDSRWILLLLTTAAVMTLSRSSALALVVGIAIILVLRGFRPRFSYMLGVGLALLIPSLVLMRGYLASFHKLTIDNSALERLIPWSRALVLFREHPVLGIGFNAVLHAQLAHGWVPLGSADVSLDAGLLAVATMTGVIGVGFYLAMLWRVMRLSRQVSRDSALAPADRAHGVATAAATAAVVVHAFFVNSILLPFVMQIFWVMWGTLMRISANRRVRTLSGTAIAAVPLVIALGGCDPCAGTNVCAASTRVDLIGQIVDPTNGVPVQGATVQVNFPDGSTAGATTDAKGSWEASRTVHSTEPLTASVVVTAPGHPGYTIPGLSVTPVTRRGDATVFDPWYAYPYAQYQATLVQNGTPLTYAQVSFKPTGGVPVTDARSLTDTTNGAGVFALALGGDQLGQVFGTLTVTGTGLAQPTVVDGYPVSLDYRYRIPGPQAVYDVNPLLTYGGQIYFRGTGRPAQGVRVTWVRTGGIQTDSATYTTTSDATGFFIFRLTPLSTGQVTGTITFTPPSGEGSTYRNITMSTYDSTTYRSLGGFSFGQRWAYGISIFRNDRNEPAAGVPVTFRRTGGIAMQPDSIQAVADSANGWLALKASVTDTGVLEGEITVYPDSGPPRVITGLKLHTYASDTMRFGGVYSFGPSLHYAGRLMDTDSVGVANAQVVWTRDFGLDATPPTLTETTDSLGYFDFWLYPPYNTEGTVSGHLTVTPGAPYASGSQYVINWVSLTTFDGLERRFSYVFLIPKP